MTLPTTWLLWMKASEHRGVRPLRRQSFIASASLLLSLALLGQRAWLLSDVPRPTATLPRRPLAVLAAVLASPGTPEAHALETEAAWTAEVGGACGAGKCFATVAEALKAMPRDCGTARVTVAAGTYREQLLLPRGPALTLEAQSAGAVTLVSWPSSGLLGLQLLGFYSREDIDLESQVAKRNRPVYPKVTHY